MGKLLQMVRPECMVEGSEQRQQRQQMHKCPGVGSLEWVCAPRLVQRGQGLRFVRCSEEAYLVITTFPAAA